VERRRAENSRERTWASSSCSVRARPFLLCLHEHFLGCLVVITRATPRYPRYSPILPQHRLEQHGWEPEAGKRR
jgi:hypothetical protein